jgi:hypothetical protein
MFSDKLLKELPIDLKIKDKESVSLKTFGIDNSNWKDQIKALLGKAFTKEEWTPIELDDSVASDIDFLQKIVKKEIPGYSNFVNEIKEAFPGLVIGQDVTFDYKNKIISVFCPVYAKDEIDFFAHKRFNNFLIIKMKVKEIINSNWNVSKEDAQFYINEIYPKFVKLEVEGKGLLINNFELHLDPKKCKYVIITSSDLVTSEETIKNFEKTIKLTKKAFGAAKESQESQEIYADSKGTEKIIKKITKSFKNLLFRIKEIDAQNDHYEFSRYGNKIDKDVKKELNNMLEKYYPVMKSETPKQLKKNGTFPKNWTEDNIMKFLSHLRKEEKIIKLIKDNNGFSELEIIKNKKNEYEIKYVGHPAKTEEYFKNKKNKYSLTSLLNNFSNEILREEILIDDNKLMMIMKNPNILSENTIVNSTAQILVECNDGRSTEKIDIYNKDDEFLRNLYKIVTDAMMTHCEYDIGAGAQNLNVAARIPLYVLLFQRNLKNKTWYFKKRYFGLDKDSDGKLKIKSSSEGEKEGREHLKDMTSSFTHVGKSIIVYKDIIDLVKTAEYDVKKMNEKITYNLDPDSAYVWEYEWIPAKDNNKQATRNPKNKASWFLVEDMDTLYKYEYMFQEMKSVISMTKLKINTEYKEDEENEVIKELHREQKEKLEEVKFAHEFKIVNTKFNWTIIYGKEVQAKFYENEKLFESEKGVEVGTQINDKNGEKRKLRRFENCKNAGYEVDPCKKSRRKINIEQEEDKDFIEQSESNVTEANFIRMISSSLKNPFVNSRSTKNNYKLIVQAPRNKIKDISEKITQKLENKENWEEFSIELTEENLAIYANLKDWLSKQWRTNDKNKVKSPNFWDIMMINFFIELKKMIDNKINRGEKWFFDTNWIFKSDQHVDSNVLLEKVISDKNWELLETSIQIKHKVFKIQNFLMNLICKTSIEYMKEKTDNQIKMRYAMIYFTSKDVAKWIKLYSSIDIAYVSFIVNQFTEELKTAIESESKQKSMEAINTKLMSKNWPGGHYVIVEVSCDEEVSATINNIIGNNTCVSTCLLCWD